jgi:hypothetical protein
VCFGFGIQWFDIIFNLEHLKKAWKMHAINYMESVTINDYAKETW